MGVLHSCASERPAPGQYSPSVAEVSQADFMRAVRGGQVLTGQGQEIEPIVGGVVSISKCAVREVHRRSPAYALSYFNARTAKWLFQGGRAAATVRSYRARLDQYIAWDGGSGPAEAFDVGLKMPPIVYAPGDSVRALAHVVRKSGDASTARVLVWDDLPLDADGAEMIALPVVDRLEEVYGEGSATGVEVWQLDQPVRHNVTPEDAHARRSEVRDLLAELNDRRKQ